MSIYKHNILLIDDDSSVFESAKILLCDEYNLEYASCCEKALEYFDSETASADLILLDIMMPVTDGYATLAKLREKRAARDVPVIFLTGASEASNEIKALKQGARDFISKPFNPAVFLARIELCIASENQICLSKLEQAAPDLTKNELIILKHITKGYSNEEISNELHYSYGYVKQLVSKIFEKMSITGRKELKKFYRD